MVRSVAQNHYRFLYRIITNTGTGDPRDEKTLQLLWRHALEPPMNALPTTLRYGCMKLWSVAKSFNVKNVDPDEEEKKWVRVVFEVREFESLTRILLTRILLTRNKITQI